MFQSHFWDADVGLYHMRARMFDPRSGTFLSRDPSGYVDSVNLYAPMKWDPIGNRDPTGQCVWEGDPRKQNECWEAAGRHVQGDPRSCAEEIRRVLSNESVVLTEENALCVFAVYSMKPGVTIRDNRPYGAKQRGAELDQDRVHRKMVRLFAEFLLQRAARGGADDIADAARQSTSAYRRVPRLTESLLGRDVNRYLYGRSHPLFASMASPIYEGHKAIFPPAWWITESADPAAARGGSYFLDRGLEDRACSDATTVPVFESGDEKDSAVCPGVPRRGPHLSAEPLPRVQTYPVSFAP